MLCGRLHHPFIPSHTTEYRLECAILSIRAVHIASSAPAMVKRWWLLRWWCMVCTHMCVGYWFTSVQQLLVGLNGTMAQHDAYVAVITANSRQQSRTQVSFRTARTTSHASTLSARRVFKQTHTHTQRQAEKLVANLQRPTNAAGKSLVLRAFARIRIR